MIGTMVRIGDEPRAHVRIEIDDFAHPDTAEPHGLDLLNCRVHACAPPLRATFDLAVRVDEFLELRAYLAEINSGNGPQASFTFAGGVFALSFAPSRRGPILCAVQLKSIDAAHLRIEYLVTLEPDSITRAIRDIDLLERATT